MLEKYSELIANNAFASLFAPEGTDFSAATLLRELPSPYADRRDQAFALDGKLLIKWDDGLAPVWYQLGALRADAAR